MPSVIVDVSPNIINWVIQNIPSEKADTQILDSLEQWKSGDKKPTFRQVESLSKTTNIPLGYFFLQAPPVEEFPILEYRTIDSSTAMKPSRNLIDTINYAESVQEWMRDYLTGMDIDKLSFVGSQLNCHNVLNIADNIRNTLNLEINWSTLASDIRGSFKGLRNNMECAGILVMMSGIVGKNTHRKLNIDEFRAFTLIDDYAPLIFINANDSQGGKLFSLLHEAVHVWLGINNFFNDRHGQFNNINSTESLCNAVAAEILVPNSLFIKIWREHIQKISVDEAIKKVASYFNCSETVVARRALDNQYIDVTKYQIIVKEAIQNYYKSLANRSSGGDYYATAITRLDNRFIMALDNSVKEGKTQFTDAYRLTNTTGKTFSVLIEKAKGNNDA